MIAMRSKKIGWAVVGMGQQGERLATAIAASGQELVAAVSERQPGSFAAALRDPRVEAIAIATPNDAHMAPVIAAAKAGKHVLCEKPLALTSREGRTMQAAVRKVNVRCFVNYHLRMHEEAQRARKVLASGKLGNITH